MGTIKQDEIRGIHVSGEVLCSNCATDEEMKNVKEEEIISENMAEKDDTLYFCDRCKERL